MDGSLGVVIMPLLKIMDAHLLVNGGINYRQRLAEQILEAQRFPRIYETK